jgi:hypothetical protein
MSDNFLNIQQQPDQATEITLNVPVPKLAGILEQLIINFYDQFKTRFIVVRAIDDSYFLSFDFCSLEYKL